MAKKKGRRKKDGKQTRLTVLNEDMYRRETSLGNDLPPRKIDTVEYQNKIERIYELIRDGMRTEEIRAELLLEDPELATDMFNKMIKHAYELGEASLQKDREYVFQLHMDRYEKMYEKSIEMVDLHHRPLDHKINHNDWAVICAKYLQAMKQLKSKEDLIGLHDKSIVLEFNNNTALVANIETNEGPNEVPGYDLNKLSLEEMKEMLAIIKDCRTVPIEGEQRVMVKTMKIEITDGIPNRVQHETVIDKVETTDITFEEMPQDVVSKFDNILPPVVHENIGNPIIDSVPEHLKNLSKKNPDDLKQAIHTNLVEQFKKKLKENKK